MNTKQENHSMTTLLVLIQCFLFHIDELPKKQTFFQKEIKFACNILRKEIEKVMNKYFLLAKEEGGQYEQADIINNATKLFDWSMITSFTLADRPIEQQDKFHSDLQLLLKEHNLDV